MVKLKLSVMDTHDRAVWRSGILGNRLTCAWKMTFNDDDNDDADDDDDDV